MDNSILVKIMGTSYSVGFPTVQQHMEIESLKHQFSNGQYGDMVRTGTKSATVNLDIVDAVSTFQVLVPEIKDKLTMKSLSTMDMSVGLSLANSFAKVYYPWYQEKMNQLHKEYDELLKDGK